MGLFRYSEDELRDMLRRAIKTRWPTEDLGVIASLVDGHGRAAA
jgi:hypothetical protein